MSDNELDNLFKEAADGFKAPNDPSAWKDMSSRLDQAIGTTSFWDWKSISGITVVGVTVVALVWYLSSSDKGELLSNASPSGNLSNVSPANSQPANNQASLSVPHVETDNGIANKKVNSKQKQSQAQESHGNSKRSISTTSNGVGQEKILATPQNHLSEIKNSSELKNTELNISEVKSSDDLSSESKNSNQLTTATPVATVAGVQVSQKSNPSVQADSLSMVEEDQKEVPAGKDITEDEEEKPEEAVKSGSPFAIKLTVAPDYTAVKSSTPEGLGVNYGALFEYRFNEHWSIATGGIWTKKIYTVYDVEYNGRNADKVNGDCRMWDIPINVYYNFFPNKRFSFYSSLGLSSYIMNEENYVYYVQGAYGTYDYTQQIKGENNEWFKTLNVSVGMQWRASTYFSFQFEPTLKAPLAGVGEGEVSLVSLGAFLNVRYEIPFKKSGGNDKIK